MRRARRTKPFGAATLFSARLNRCRSDRGRPAVAFTPRLGSLEISRPAGPGRTWAFARRALLSGRHPPRRPLLNQRPSDATDRSAHRAGDDPANHSSKSGVCNSFGFRSADPRRLAFLSHKSVVGSSCPTLVRLALRRATGQRQSVRGLLALPTLSPPGARRSSRRMG